jgi:hypothetical protein
LLVEARAIIQDVQSNADATVNRTIREADERIAWLKAEAENQIGRLQNELAQATRGTDQVKVEVDKRIECVKMETDARVASVEIDAKKRIDIIRRENENKILRLEADLTQAKNRANHAEQWLMLIRREIEEHLMPAMRYGPKPTSSARPGSSTVPSQSRSLASIWFRRLWLRVTASALGCRVGADMESATPLSRLPVGLKAPFQLSEKSRTALDVLACRPSGPSTISVAPASYGPFNGGRLLEPHCDWAVIDVPHCIDPSASFTGCGTRERAHPRREHSDPEVAAGDCARSRS